MDIDLINFDEGYSLEEATALINRHVLRRAQLFFDADADLSELGFICGVIHLNDEIEVIVKFPDILIQLPKHRVQTNLIFIPDDDDL